MEEKLQRFKTTVRLGEGPGWGVEYWTEEDWEEHREYIETLKKEGRYLEEVEMTIDIVPCPLFDEPIKGSPINPKDKAVAMLIPTTNL